MRLCVYEQNCKIITCFRAPSTDYGIIECAADKSYYAYDVYYDK